MSLRDKRLFSLADKIEAKEKPVVKDSQSGISRTTSNKLKGKKDEIKTKGKKK